MKRGLIFLAFAMLAGVLVAQTPYPGPPPIPGPTPRHGAPFW